MGVARWRWLLVPMVVVVGGCLPQPAVQLPESLRSRFDEEGLTFTVQAPPAGATGQAVVGALRAQDPRFGGRALPVFGVMDCNGDPGCQPLHGDDGGARTAWVVVYPDCNDSVDPGFVTVSVPPVVIDVAWVVIDAVDGVADGEYWSNTPCPNLDP